MKYYIKTFGCQMNESDSERIATSFDSQGLQKTKEIKTADLVIFNTCGVRQTAEDRVYGQVHNLRKASPGVKIVITGCVAHRKDVQRKLKDKVNLFISIKDIKKIPELLFPQESKEISREHEEYLDIIPKYAKKESAFVPIMTGCDNFCSYCVVPYARGREYSRPVEEIFKEIKKLSENGCKEVTLLGQNVNSYFYKIKSQKSKVKTTTKNSKLNSQKLIENLDLKINWKLEIGNWKFKRQSKNKDVVTFPLLLNTLAKTYPKISWRFLTSHPKDFSEELMNVVAENKNIPNKIHLPVQSGSDKILKAMNRPYTQKHYLDLIKKAQEIIPGVTFTTDVIIGFPGETEDDFQETVKVFKEVGYTDAYTNKYSPRPETAALKLGDPIDWNEKKRREKVLRELIKK